MSSKKKESGEEPEAPKAEAPKEKKEKKQPKAKEAAQSAKKAEEGENFRHMVRIAQTNIDGHRTVEFGIQGIAGIGRRLAIVICDLSNIQRSKKIGNLTDEELAKLTQTVESAGDERFPYWMLNRQMDPWEGADGHMVSQDIQTVVKDDVNMMKKMKCYKGVRHEQGQKVRGQRSRSNGRTGLTVGVIKSAALRQAAAAKEGGGDK